MNDTQSPKDAPGNASRDEIMSALFAGLVVQQTNLAMMLLGRSPHPETQKTIQDIDGAKMFIDQLEMLEAKTKGNLTKEEEQLLKQNLTALRMAFVEAVNSPATPSGGGKPAASEEKAAPLAEPAAGDDAESKRKFSKKY